MQITFTSKNLWRALLLFSVLFAGIVGAEYLIHWLFGFSMESIRHSFLFSAVLLIVYEVYKQNKKVDNKDETK